jgi:transmembrane sensor
MNPDVFRALLEKYERGECSPEEKELVERWYNNLPVDDAAPSNLTGERIWADIVAKNKIKKPNTIHWFLRIAAAVAVLLLIGSVLFNRSQLSVPELITAQQAIPNIPEHTYTKDFENTSTTPQHITLEDGSTIVLQPGGRISYPAAFDSESRSVSLSGEAFFSIQRDERKPFYVFTREVVTKVLGTSFTIKAHDTDPEITVAVRTGKVRVFTNPGDVQKRASIVTLTPNQQIVYNREALEISKRLVEKPEIVLEKPTLFEMKYDGVSVSRILKVLEENYGVEIQFDEELWDECILTTKMTNEGLIERIEIITKAIGATFTVDDAVIVIHGNGCN